MKIISWNVNRIRSVYKKGFKKWLEKADADIVCLQEIKAQKEEIEPLAHCGRDADFLWRAWGCG